VKSLTLAVVFTLWLSAWRPVVSFASPVTNSAHTRVDGRPTESATNCNALDVVIAVDQSGSMKLNDPLQFRDDAVKTALTQLGDNALYFCPGAQHRLAVIGFGDDPAGGGPEVVTYIPPVDVSPQLNDLQGWHTKRQRLADLMPASDELGATDHISAFEAASQILEAWRLSPLGDHPRKRAVILITDGQPCRRAEGCLENDYHFNLGRYLDEMETLTDAGGTAFPWHGEDHPESIYLWVIALNVLPSGDADNATPAPIYLNNPQLRDAWTKLAASHGGQLLVLSDARRANLDLTAVVSQALDPMLGSNLQPWPCELPIIVQPYLNNITVIHIWKQGANPNVNPEDVRVRIRINPGTAEEAVVEAGQLSAGEGAVSDYVRDGPNERYVFNNPRPGKYVIEVDSTQATCSDLDVRLGEVGIQAALLAPQALVLPVINTSPYFDDATGQHFQFALTQLGLDGLNQPLAEMANYPIALRVTVVAPDGSVVDYPLQLSTIVGAYEGLDYIQTPQAGNYQWSLLGTAPNPLRTDPVTPNAAPVVVISATGRFDGAVLPTFDFAIVSPVGNARLALNTVQTGGQQSPEAIPVRVRFSADRPLADILTSPLTQTYLVQLYGPDNNLVEQLPLLPDAAAPGDFVATLRADPSALDPAGQYTLVVAFDGSYDPQKFSPVQREVRTTLERFEIQPVWAEVVVPETTHVHPGGAGCVQGLIEPFSLAVRFLVGSDNQAVSPSEVVATGQPLLTVTAADGATQAVGLTLADGGVQLVGAAGQQMGAGGAYTATLDVSGVTLAEGYAWALEASQGTFQRTDLFWTTPLVCQGATGLAGLITLLVVAFLVYLVTGGPRGTLTIVESFKTPYNELGGPWRLSFSPRTNRLSNRVLKGMGIRTLKVKRTRPVLVDGGGRQRAVSVAIVLDKGGMTEIPQLLTDQPMPLSGVSLTTTDNMGNTRAYEVEILYR